MTTPTSPPSQPGKRLAQLQKLLERTPDDPFLLYGIAMEHKNAGDTSAALDFFRARVAARSRISVRISPARLTFEMIGDPAAAKSSYREGIEAARRKGDMHAAGEIEGALAAMEE